MKHRVTNDICSAEDILSMKPDDSSVRVINDLVEMFLDFCLKNSDNMCNYVLPILTNNGQTLVDFCSQFKEMESIKNNRETRETLKYISARGFKMESYVSEDDVHVPFYVWDEVDGVKSHISPTLSESIITKISVNSSVRIHSMKSNHGQAEIVAERFIKDALLMVIIEERKRVMV